MSVLISGSVAYDAVLAHDGRFAEHLRPEALEHLNLTFQVSRIRRSFGGCAANIAYALKLLGGEPILWCAMGSDAGPYMDRLQRLGISTTGLQILPDELCAQCFIAADADGNQLAFFHGGAMERSQEVDWPAAPADDPIELAVLAPGGRIAMQHHAQLCAARGIPFIFDVGQAAPLFSKEELRSIIDKAAMLAFSDYEAALLEHAAGLSPADMAAMGKIVFHTHGGKGSSVWTAHAKKPVPIEAAPIPGGRAVDPVGAGDAYRGGLVSGLIRGLSPVAAARLGSVMGAVKVGTEGAQNYAATLEDAEARCRSVWGSGWQNV